MALWDDFMASSIAGYVSAAPRPGAGPFGRPSVGTERMVVLVGSSHVRGRVGIPERFEKRANLPTFTMVPARWNQLGKPRGPALVPPSEADWVLYTRPQPPQRDLSLTVNRRLAGAALTV